MMMPLLGATEAGKLLDCLLALVQMARYYERQAVQRGIWLLKPSPSRKTCLDWTFRRPLAHPNALEIWLDSHTAYWGKEYCESEGLILSHLLRQIKGVEPCTSVGDPRISTPDYMTRALNRE